MAWGSEAHPVLPASTYFFHLPVDEREDREIETYERKYLTWVSEPGGGSDDANLADASSSHSPSVRGKNSILDEVLSNDDLYQVLGITKSAHLDKLALRRAYLSRSRACHPEYALFTTFPVA